jgi:hypothetical protein
MRQIGQMPPETSDQILDVFALHGNAYRIQQVAEKIGDGGRVPLPYVKSRLVNAGIEGDAEA